MNRKVITAFVAILCAAALLLGGYYKMSQNNESQEEEAELPSSEIEKLKAKDLENSYPGTPSEVVKMYWRLNQCLYNTEMKEEDLEDLLKQLRLLYDEEFLEYEENSWEKMLGRLKAEIKAFSKEGRLISSYTVDNDSDVKYATQDGRKCATLDTSMFESVKSKHTIVYEEFLCRQDKNGKWKILGWKEIDNEEE